MALCEFRTLNDYLKPLGMTCHLTACQMPCDLQSFRHMMPPTKLTYHLVVSTYNYNTVG